jgi:hypothetical protein
MSDDKKNCLYCGNPPTPIAYTSHVHVCRDCEEKKAIEINIEMINNNFEHIDDLVLTKDILKIHMEVHKEINFTFGNFRMLKNILGWNDFSITTKRRRNQYDFSCENYYSYIFKKI